MNRMFFLATAATFLLCITSYGQAPNVELAPQSAGMRVSADGSTAGHYSFEGTTNLTDGQWDLLSTLPGSQAQQGWLHARSTTFPQFFYRAFWTSDYEPQAAENFRLI